MIDTSDIFVNKGFLIRIFTDNVVTMLNVNLVCTTPNLRNILVCLKMIIGSLVAEHKF